MSINTITYSNKSDINTTATPAQNKVSASDMNEIKTVVNNNANLMGDVSTLSTGSPNVVSSINTISKYSTTETVCGTWIDSKPIYRKVIDTTYSGTINTNIQNLDTMIKMDVLAKQTSTNDWRNLPWLYASGSTYGDPSWGGGFYFIFASSTIKFQLGSSLDDISKLVIILEYTKTTD